MKRIMAMMVMVVGLSVTQAQAFVTLDVFRDGYVEDVVFVQTEFLDGVPDQIRDTNAILAGRADLFDQNNHIKFDSHGIMSFDILPYQGMNLTHADLFGFGYATPSSYAKSNPIQASFYSYLGDGIVGFDDFDSSADFAGNFDFYAISSPLASEEARTKQFSLDVTDAIKDYFNSGNQYLEFRVESEDIEVYISAGESELFQTDFEWDGVRHGPKLSLTFGEQSQTPPSAAVPEPATLALFGTGLFGAFLRRRKKA